MVSIPALLRLNFWSLVFIGLILGPNLSHAAHAYLDQHFLVRMNDRGEIETRKNISALWIASPLRSPPAGITYESAVLDREGNLYVLLGGEAKGFNFVGASGKPVIVFNKIRWRNGLVPKDISAIQANPQGGITAVNALGESFDIHPPHGSAEFSAVSLKKAELLEKTALSPETKPTPEVSLPQEFIPSKTYQSKISPEILADESGKRLNRVEELKFLKEAAAKIGVRAWMGGGSAFSYLHYVRQDLDRESGNKSFVPDHYNYQFTDIYRSTQDFDLFIDGTDQQAKELEELLKKRFPRERQGKSIWEVRPIATQKGAKPAMLDNPDYLNQHLDSGSTGVIEITAPQKGEPVIRDFKEWREKSPAFLKDAAYGKIHFYFSPNHSTTSRFRDGINPPILSAIRFLNKAFQANLEIPAADLQEIKKIFDNFNPATDLNNPYVKKWMEENGKKLLLNAFDLEQAWSFLEKNGFRKKLLQTGNPQLAGSLAWWMSKQPLDSKELGKSGATATDLGLDIVAHETDNFHAYEIMSSAPTNKPNVFISRGTAKGETAVSGDGFYVMNGRKGWDIHNSNQGLTIRYRLNPIAREGKDFLKNGEEILILNRNALTLLPENLSLSALDFFQTLASGKQFAREDGGLVARLKEKIASSWQSIPPKEMGAIEALISTEVEKNHPNKHLLDAWFSFPGSTRHPEWAQRTIEKGNGQLVFKNAKAWQARPEWAFWGKEAAQKALASKDQWEFRKLAEHFFSSPESVALAPEFEKIVRAADEKTLNEISKYVFSEPHSIAFKEALLETWQRSNKINLADSLFGKTHLELMRPEFSAMILHSLKTNDTLGQSMIARRAFKGEAALKLREELNRFIKGATAKEVRSDLVISAFSQPQVRQLKEELKNFMLVDETGPSYDKSGLYYLERLFRWGDLGLKNDPEFEIFMKALEAKSLNERKAILKALPDSGGACAKAFAGMISG